MKKYFETLGLKEDASQAQIQIAYERLSRELDPKNMLSEILHPFESTTSI